MKKSLIFIIIALFLVGCTNNRDFQTVHINGKTFNLEIAKTDEQRKKGLSSRATLEQNNGMLFLFGTRDIQIFWMKDTLIPLEIVFLDGCRIVDVKEMSVEPDPTNPAKTYESKTKADKAIELNADSVGLNIVGQQINELCR